MEWKLRSTNFWCWMLSSHGHGSLGFRNLMRQNPVRESVNSNSNYKYCICLFIYLLFCLFVCLFIYFSIYAFIAYSCRSLYFFICLFHSVSNMFTYASDPSSSNRFQLEPCWILRACEGCHCWSQAGLPATACRHLGKLQAARFRHLAVASLPGNDIDTS